MKNEKKNVPSKTTLVIRLLVSAYVLYLAWGLRGAPAAYTGLESIFFIVIMLVFAAFGVIFGGSALRALLRGEYSEPAAEEDEEE